MKTGRSLLYFANREEWRAWLASNHDRAGEAVLVLDRQGARSSASLTLEQAQEEALCFGWVDTRSQNIDRNRYSLRFTPRRPGSQWSLTNIRRVEQLKAEGRMTEAGLAKVAEAKQNGEWEQAILVARTDVIPTELKNALSRRKGALKRYRELSDADKRLILRRLISAKNPATRQRRVRAIAEEVAGKGVLQKR